jgi:uncharacterized protein DUF642
VKFRATLLGAVILLWDFSAQAQNLISNGDFETPPFAPSTTITNWVVSGAGDIHEAAEGSTSPTHSAALNIGADSEGTVLSQSFTTLNGQTYVLDFDAGIVGQRNGNPLQLNVKLTGNGTLIDQTVAPADAFTTDPASVIFKHYHFTFTANSATTTLQFSDIGLGNASSDTLIDTVSVMLYQNALANGDFETAPFDTIGNITSWNIGGTASVADRLVVITGPLSTWPEIHRALRSIKASVQPTDNYTRSIFLPAFLELPRTARRYSCASRLTEQAHYWMKRLRLQFRAARIRI